MIWEALSKAALMGTSRHQLPEEVKNKLEQVGISFAGGSAQAILEGAAVYYNIQRAGFPLANIPVEDMRMAEEDSNPTVSKELSRYLLLILSGRYTMVLKEYLLLLQHYQKAIPPVHLPTLFILSSKKKDIWELVEPLLGQRERHLLRHNPAWSDLADEPDTEKWEHSTINKRLKIFRFLRREAPDKATALLAESWNTLDFPSKLALLQGLEDHLGTYDEAFLEERLGDSRKEIRLQAAQLLSYISDSALQERLLAHGRDILYANEAGSILLMMPESLSAELKEDGINPKKSKYKGREAAVITFEILRKIPPRHWEAHLRKSIVDCIRSAQKNKYGELIIESWARAALRFNDLRWIESILRYWWRRQDVKSWSSALGKELMVQLSNPVFNEMVVQHFQQQEGLIEADSFIGKLLATGTHYWDRKTSALIISGFQNWMLHARTYNWNFWHYKHILKIAGYRADPALLQAFKEGWNSHSPMWEQWRPSVDSMLRVLQFRKELREKFKSNG
jgi:hypothetical protein